MAVEKTLTQTNPGKGLWLNLIWRYKFALLILVFLLIFPYFASLYHLRLLTEVFIFTVFAISYNLLLGYTGIVSLGHALFFGLGGYLGGLLMLEVGLPFLLVIPVILVVSVVLSVIIGFLTLRVKAIFFAVFTLAIAELFWIVSERWSGMTGGSDGMSLAALDFPEIFGLELFGRGMEVYYFTLIVMVLVYLFFSRFVSSPAGRVLEAIRENETRTQVLGYSVLKFKIVVITISGILATLSGFFYALTMRFLHTSYLAVDTTLDVLLMTVIGGMGTLPGPFAGALIVKLLGRVMSSITEHWLLIFGILYVLIVLFMPEGLVPGVKEQAARLRAVGNKLFKVRG